MIKKLFYLVFIFFGVVMAVPSLRAEFTTRATPLVDELKVRFVPRTLDAMVTQLDGRLRRGEGMPRDFEVWLEREFTGSPTDPWENLYYIQLGPRDYFVGSMGPDGVRGTEDDIRTPPRPLTGAGTSTR